MMARGCPGPSRRPPMLSILALIDDAKCFQTVPLMRWPEGGRCARCRCAEVTRDGHDDSQPERQRYRCLKQFDDLSGTLFSEHHQPLRVRVLCLLFMGLNRSNERIAQEPGIDPN